jgi:hypothetical protein
VLLLVPLKDQQPRRQNKRRVAQLPIKAISGKSFFGLIELA